MCWYIAAEADSISSNAAKLLEKNKFNTEASAVVLVVFFFLKCTVSLMLFYYYYFFLQGLINQLKEAIPTLQKSITELTGEVNAISGSTTDELNSSGSRFSVQTQNTEHGVDELADMASKLSTLQIEKAPSPAPKLPYLFSMTPNPPGKSTQTPKRNVGTTQMSTQTVSNESVLQREAALTTQPSLTMNDKKHHTTQG